MVVAPRGVQGRTVFQGSGHRFQGKGQVGQVDALALPEPIAFPVPQRDQFGDIDLHHAPGVGDLAHRAFHRLGDHAPHRGQRHPFLIGSDRSCRRGGGRFRRDDGSPRGRRGSLQVTEHVVAGDAPAHSRSGDRVNVDVVLTCQPPHCRRQAVGSPLAIGASRRGRDDAGFDLRRRRFRRRGRYRRLLRRQRGAAGRAHGLRVYEVGDGNGRRFAGIPRRRGRRLDFPLRGRRRRSGLRRGGRLPVLRFHFGDGRAHGHGFAFLGDDAEQLPGHRRRNLHGHLVGDHLHQRVIPFDPISRLLQPLPDGALNDALADVGQLNHLCHGIIPSVSRPPIAGFLRQSTPGWACRRLPAIARMAWWARPARTAGRWGRPGIQRLRPPPAPPPRRQCRR